MTEREVIERLFRRIDYRMNDGLCGMKPNYDDSITGFNEAWDVMRKTFHDALAELKDC